MKKYTLVIYKRRYWDFAELFCDGLLIMSINKFYEVDKDFVYNYETEGGTGYGFSKGKLIQKVYIGDGEFKTEYKEHFV